MFIKNNARLITKILSITLLTILSVCITVFRVPEELEVLAEDSLFQRPDVISNDIKIIAIDETTLSELGPYSEWDRTVFAGLIEKLNESPETKP